MARVVFYEKPGCQGNKRQKALLEAAGHTVEARDLRQEPWTAERLLAFLSPLPVAEWFNRSAPAVKSGEIVPENLGFETALHLLLDQPLLIRRPLLQVGEERRVGFDAQAVAAWIGLDGVTLPDDDIGSCVHGAEGHGRCGAH
jgi:nitrogenase-associated protein